MEKENHNEGVADKSAALSAVSPAAQEDAAAIANAPAHTPGPWIVRDARREMVGDTEHFIASVDRNENDYRGPVCNMQSCDHINGITMDECEANARLIAAS